MRLTAKDRILDDADNPGTILAVVHDIAVIKPDYALGKDGYEYTLHVSRCIPLTEENNPHIKERA